MTAEISREGSDAIREDGVDRIEQAWARERPDMDVSSVGIVTRIWRIARHLERERVERLTELGTDRVTLDVLAMLRRAGKPYRMTAGRLSEAALITPGGISNRLDKLERSGLIKRSFHPKDRRRVDVQLTKKGVQLVDEVVSDVMDHDTRLLEALDDGDQADLRRLLKLLLAQFEDPEDGLETD
ncbi:MarR family transcriptional regulator [Rhodococcus sp. WS1]|uniref:MarR family winged helix-turn-helix transcriptional regulator n=1 Tax=unclassified Rhodococcus (in: high G+C Gram-positive bacteria) TaxID=192944 RepID=UPI001141B550|nr:MULTISPECIES: MarR family transcriptional regulator [unclassified Rhodococcus (in: high G+C Gram-positive bacteria)]ROZ52971.1 MarR family transcriptional regulator [Rhodococcus sp. WS1]TQC36063.1 MarR family transcriptional regulator [Rhodococcus sp. WS7]